jgi:ATP-dependent Lhr-like helicase
VQAPPMPNHIVAQQILALCLQEKRIGDHRWIDAWNGLEPFTADAQPILDHLVAEGFLETDGGMLFIGPSAEKRFGSKHFADLTAVFCAPPEFTVMHGREEIGRIDPSILTADEGRGTRLILLAGRTWLPGHIDWRRRICHVEPVQGEGDAKWSSIGLATGKSFELNQAIRDVLLGEDPPVKLTTRAIDALADARERHESHVDPHALVLHKSGSELRWWTWAGYRANLTLQASLGPHAHFDGVSDFCLRLSNEIPSDKLSRTLSKIELTAPIPDPMAVRGLKFSDALPETLATLTLSARLIDPRAAQKVIDHPRFIMV